jgi:hypothetical protein
VQAGGESLPLPIDQPAVGWIHQQGVLVQEIDTNDGKIHCS